MHTLDAGVTAVTTAEAAASDLVGLAVPWDDVVGVLTPLPPWPQHMVIETTNPLHGRAGALNILREKLRSVSWSFASLSQCTPTPSLQPRNTSVAARRDHSGGDDERVL